MKKIPDHRNHDSELKESIGSEFQSCAFLIFCSKNTGLIGFNTVLKSFAEAEKKQKPLAQKFI